MRSATIFSIFESIAASILDARVALGSFHNASFISGTCFIVGTEGTGGAGYSWLSIFERPPEVGKFIPLLRSFWGFLF